MYDKLLKLFGKTGLPLYKIEINYNDIINTECLVGKDWDSKDQPTLRVQYGKDLIEEMTETYYVENFLYSIRDKTRKNFRKSKTEEETHERDWILLETLQKHFGNNELFSMPNAFLGIEYSFVKPWPNTEPVAIVYYPCDGDVEQKRKHYMAISGRHRKYGGLCALVDIDWLHLSEKANRISAIVEFKNTKYVRIKNHLDRLNQEPLMQVAHMINARFVKILYTKEKYNDFKVLVGGFDQLEHFLKNGLTKLKK